MLQGGIWSPEGKYLLLYYQYEWDADYFIYNLETGDTETLILDLPGYFLTTPTGWLDDQRLVFTTRASRKKDGTQEYSFGNHSDLAVYDLETKKTTLISNADDGEYLKMACPPAVPGFSFSVILRMIQVPVVLA